MACTAKLKESGQKAAPEAPEVRSLPVGVCHTVQPESGAIIANPFPFLPIPSL